VHEFLLVHPVARPSSVSAPPPSRPKCWRPMLRAQRAHPIRCRRRRRRSRWTTGNLPVRLSTPRQSVQRPVGLSIFRSQPHALCRWLFERCSQHDRSVLNGEIARRHPIKGVAALPAMQELLGHHDMTMTMIDTHVQYGARGARSLPTRSTAGPPGVRTDGDGCGHPDARTGTRWRSAQPRVQLLPRRRSRYRVRRCVVHFE